MCLFSQVAASFSFVCLESGSANDENLLQISDRKFIKQSAENINSCVIKLRRHKSNKYKKTIGIISQIHFFWLISIIIIDYALLFSINFLLAKNVQVAYHVSCYFVHAFAREVSCAQ